jgi:hypothetical protein
MTKTRAVLMAATVTVYIVCPPYRYYAIGALMLHSLISGVRNAKAARKA